MALSHHVIRQAMRLRRQKIALGAQQRAAWRLSHKITSTPYYQQSQHIAFYTALKGEIELGPIIKKAWAQGKSCYLPVVSGQGLCFVRYRPTSIMRANRFGILEPIGEAQIAPKQLDLVLMPLVAFDQQCHRIGMGGGYYDRTFSQRKTSPLLVGVAHRCQQTQHITPESWDVPLDKVIAV